MDLNQSSYCESKFDRQYKARFDGFTVLLSWFPGWHQFYNANRFLVAFCTNALDYLGITDVTFLINHKAHEYGTFHTHPSGLRRILHVLGNKFCHCFEASLKCCLLLHDGENN